MALLEDKKKPYSIYAPGTPTAKAQSQQIPAMKNLGAGAVEGARKMVSGAVGAARKVSRDNLGGKYFGAALSPLDRDAAKQRAFMDKETIANKGDQRVPTSYSPPSPNYSQAALAAKYPNGKMVIDQRPLEMQSRVSDRNLGLINQNNIANKTAFAEKTLMKAQNAVAPGATPAAQAQPDLNGMARQKIAGQRRLGNQTYKVGNMDVTFDPSTSPAARKAFLTDPVKPEGQMARYDAYVNTPRGRFFGATQPPQENTGGLIRPTNLTNQAISDYNNMLTNRRGQDFGATAASENNSTTIAAEQLRGKNQLGNTTLEGQINTARDRMNLDANAPVREAQANSLNASAASSREQAAGQALSNEDTNRMSMLREQYLSEKDPVKKEDAANKLKAMIGKGDEKGQWIDFEEPVIGEDGKPTGDFRKAQAFQDANGKVRKLSDMLYEQDALGLLRGGKLSLQEFIAEFGYDPTKK